MHDKSQELLFIRVYCISSIIRRSVFLSKTPKNLDPFYKMDLDLWDYLGRVKLVDKT